MFIKTRSLQQNAKQSQSINVTQISFFDYIDERVQHDQVSHFKLSNELQQKQMDSNSQHKKSSRIEKSTLQNGEIKVYKERVRALQNRLKEKNQNLKLKEQHISQLMSRNQSLQAQMIEKLFTNHLEKIPPTTIMLTHQPKQKSDIQIQTICNDNDTTQIKVKNQDNLGKQTSINNAYKQQVIQLRSELQKYRKKYLVIEQSLKRRTVQFQMELEMLNKKIKQQKQLNANLQQENQILQEQNIDNKEKLQQTFEEIQQLQFENQNLSNKIINLQKQNERLSFGHELKSVILNATNKPKSQIILVSGLVKQNVLPFKKESIKRTMHLIRNYPRIYQQKIYPCKKLLQIAHNITLQIKNNCSNQQRKKPNLKIYPRQINFQNVNHTLNKNQSLRTIEINKNSQLFEQIEKEQLLKNKELKVLDKINMYLKKSQSCQCLSNQKQLLNLDKKYQDQIIQPQAIRDSSNFFQKQRTIKNHSYRTSIIDDIKISTDRLLSKYHSSNKSIEVSKEKTFTSLKGQQKQFIERHKRSVLNKSNSREILCQDQQNYFLHQDPSIRRNTSLSSLNNVGNPQSYLKPNDFASNSSQGRQLPLLNKSQDLNEIKSATVQLPSNYNTSSSLKQQSTKNSQQISIKDLIAQKCKRLSIG